MYIEIHDKLGGARRLQCTRVVVHDDLGNPVALAVEYQEGLIMASTAEHEDFNRMLYNLGLDKVVIVKPMTVNPLH